jgi:hypothetical protein
MLSVANAKVPPSYQISTVILKQINDREQVCEKLDAENELLKSELEKEKKGSKFENS